MSDIVLKSTLTPSSQNPQGTTSQVRLFKITDIPAAMDKMGWQVSAQLMRHWFQGKPWGTASGGMTAAVKNHDQMPPPQYMEETIVTYKWLMTFPRVVRSRNELRTAWNNPQATKLIRRNILRAFGQHSGGCFPLSFNGQGSKAEAFGYANSRALTFDTIGDELNDLRGALANFNLRVAVEGTVNTFPDKVTFIAERIGFYAEDAYDFNDEGLLSQPLGYWNFDGIAEGVTDSLSNNANIDYEKAKAIATAPFTGEDVEQSFKDLESKRYFLITNSHFVKYRSTQKKGGDFVVYSNIGYETITPVVFEFKK
ncbi:hypothetical protein DBR00_03385 [Pseudomonas sp. HMWF032]|uniref:DUF6402 family protein n=1 Tax=Pseudomonas sp. HMWF032 TaxID=2056866 RepID=UPI000D35C902|nr:DUF6402 family protein [Pseudomonas sp. HMWF032]PTS84854.1 hypothetical protein DBR00_03385 [Pseudomonas sp. HMWF032]PTT84374.1 hypothetical protein DBR41_07605 [Pseudomonas sp. HMWF010]